MAYKRKSDLDIEGRIKVGVSSTIDTGSIHSSILGGSGNTLDNSSTHSSILGGENNKIDSSNHASIAGGKENTIVNYGIASFEFIGGGYKNRIDNYSNHASIVGGRYNNISGYGYQSFVGGGQNNTIGSGSKHSSIVGGRYNNISGADYSFIGGGGSSVDFNTIESSILGTSERSSILNGRDNLISGMKYSTILGGKGSSIKSDFTTIIGTNNTINTGSTLSSVLGGSGNTINHVNSFILGSDITSVSVNTTHVEGLNVSSVGSGTPQTILATTSGGEVVDGVGLLGSYSAQTLSFDGTGLTISNGGNTTDLSELIGPWEDGTGTSSAILRNTSNVTSGDYSISHGGSVSEVGGIQGFNTASNTGSHAEGVYTYATGHGSHSEGGGTTSSGLWSHSEGRNTVASNTGAHAEGNGTIADGQYSHSQGEHTYAKGRSSFASGKGYDTSNKVIAQSSSSFAHFQITQTNGNMGAQADNSSILGGQNHNIDLSSYRSSILGGSGNKIIGSTNTTIIGGSNITGTTNNTTYVPNLNIGTVGTGVAVTLLATTSNGMVVDGSSLIPSGGTGGGSVDVVGVSDNDGTYTYYSTLQEGIDAASAGQTVKLFADIIETGNVEVLLKHLVILDLNGHTYKLDTNDDIDAITMTGTSETYYIYNGIVERVASGGSATRKTCLNIKNGCTVYGDDTIFLNVNGFSNNAIRIRESTGINLVAVASLTGIFMAIDGLLIDCKSTGQDGYRMTGGKAVRCVGRGTSQSGFDVSVGGTLIDCVGYASSLYGIENAGQAVNCVGYSSGNVGFYAKGSSNNTKCTGKSDGSYGYRADAGSTNVDFVGISSVNYGVYHLLVSGAFNADTYLLNGSAISYAAPAMYVDNSTTSVGRGVYIDKCTIFSKWDNVGGHALVLDGTTPSKYVSNNTMLTINTTASCLESTVSGYLLNSVFGDIATTPVNGSFTNSMTNTPDAYGNIQMG